MAATYYTTPFPISHTKITFQVYPWSPGPPSQPIWANISYFSQTLSNNSSSNGKHIFTFSLPCKISKVSNFVEFTTLASLQTYLSCFQFSNPSSFAQVLSVAATRWCYIQSKRKAEPESSTCLRGCIPNNNTNNKGQWWRKMASWTSWSVTSSSSIKSSLETRSLK